MGSWECGSDLLLSPLCLLLHLPYLPPHSLPFPAVFLTFPSKSPFTYPDTVNGPNSTKAKLSKLDGNRGFLCIYTFLNSFMCDTFYAEQTHKLYVGLFQVLLKHSIFSEI